MHDLGPEIRRAISGSLEDEDAFKSMFDDEEPTHRVNFNLNLKLLNYFTVNFKHLFKQRNHTLFGIVTSMLPFKSFNYDTSNSQQNGNYYQTNHQNMQSQSSTIDPKRITISRNFSTSGDGKSLLHQTFDTKILERNAGAPLRSAVNIRNHFESFPTGLL